MPSPPTRARALPPDERRAAIVAATVPLLIEFGEKVTSRQIAQAAGVAEGTIFGVFDDKEALLVAALRELTSTAVVEEQIADINPDLPFDQQLLVVIDIQQHQIRDIFAAMSGISPQLRTQVAGPLSRSEALVNLMNAHRDKLRRDPEVSAKQLRAVVIAMTHPMLGQDTATSAEVLDLFLHGSLRSPSDCSHEVRNEAHAQ